MQIDVLHDPEDWGKERGPIPSLLVDVDELARQYGLNPSQTASLRSVLQPGKAPTNRVRPTIRVKPTVPPEVIAKRELRRQVKAREREIAPLPVEWATGWDAKTGKQILNKTDNQTSSVSFTPQQTAQLRDAIFTHNHPRSSSFSREDVGFAVAHDLAEIRATSVRYDHVLTRPAGGWPKPDGVFNASYKAEADLYSRVAQRRGRQPTDEEWKVEWHRMWRMVFKQFGVSYRRTKHVP